jgi:dihydropteroate synthase
MNKPGKDTDFNMKNSLNCSGKLLDLSTVSIMGILNLTPDSFYDGGKNLSPDAYLKTSNKMLEQGAKIIDIGGQSTRPGATRLTEEEEWQRLKTPLSELVKEFPDTIFSIDTFYSSIARRAVHIGASMVNDVSAGSIDPDMFKVVSELNVPYVLMHMQGEPATMQIKPEYADVMTEMINFFATKIRKLRQAGQIDIIIDPGFGFGKTTEHNFQILKNLDMLNITGLPILAGLSRKSMVSNVLDIKISDSLNGTTVLNTIALMNGAKILRVHDVKESMDAVKLVEKLKSV